jgi:hypothetical protein
MPTATVRLEAWSDPTRTEFQVEFDPANITAGPTDTGCVLQVILKITPEGNVVTGPALLAVHGSLRLAEPAPTAGGVEVPMQSLHPNNRILRIPLTTADLYRIEARRGFTEVSCQLMLSGLANVLFQPFPNPPYKGELQAVVTVPVHSNMHAPFTIEREHWLRLLTQARFASARLLELPTLASPAASEWAGCNTLLERAAAQLRGGESEPAMATCRQVLEGLVIVIGKHWGLAPPRPGQEGMEGWLKELAGRLGSSWPEDAYAAKVLTSLYSALWSWTSRSHHYGSSVPLHQEAGFAVGLTAELLTHAGHLLAAHPTPLTSPPAVNDLPQKGPGDL